MKYVKKIHAVEYHRNGVCGEPFNVITFTSQDDNAMIATIFESPGHVAVLSLGLLAEGNIRFGSNSWRGDRYEDELRTAIKERELELYGDFEG